jgi:membrane protease YdiL (CAAX protease family)
MSAPPDIEPEQQDPISDRLPSEDGYVGVPRSAVGAREIIGAVLVVIGVSLVGFILVAIFDPSLTAGNADDLSDGGALALQAFTVLGFIIGAFAATMVANGGGLADAARRLGMRAFGPRILVTLLIAIAAYLFLAGLIAALLQPQQEDIAETLGADEDAALVVTIAAGILIVGGAAIGEELFFRGLLFGGFRERMSLWPAALLSGVVFGLPHLPTGDLAVGVQLAVFGTVLAWAYERSGTLWAPITLHALNNTLAFLVLIDVIKI